MAKPRGRDLGLPFPGETGRYNAITDVPGVEVGFATRIEGEGPLVEGRGPVRTGVTAILPLGRQPTPEATRYFCRECGTHLAFVIDGAAELDVTVGSLRDPAAAKPGYHIFADTRLPWLRLADDLPEYDDWGPDV